MAYTYTYLKFAHVFIDQFVLYIFVTCSVCMCWYWGLETARQEGPMFRLFPPSVSTPFLRLLLPGEPEPPHPLCCSGEPTSGLLRPRLLVIVKLFCPCHSKGSTVTSWSKPRLSGVLLQPLPGRGLRPPRPPSVSRLLPWAGSRPPSRGVGGGRPSSRQMVPASS